MKKNRLIECFEKKSKWKKEEIIKYLNISPSTFYNEKNRLKDQGYDLRKDNGYYILVVTKGKNGVKYNIKKSDITKAIILDTILKNRTENGIERQKLLKDSQIKRRIGERALDKRLRELEKLNFIKRSYKGKKVYYALEETFYNSFEIFTLIDLRHYGESVTMINHILERSEIEKSIANIVKRKHVRYLSGSNSIEIENVIKKLSKIEDEHKLCKFTLKNGIELKATPVFLHFDLESEKFYETLLYKNRKNSYELISLEKIEDVKIIGDSRISKDQIEKTILDLKIKGINYFEVIETEIEFYRYYNNIEIAKNKLSNLGEFYKKDCKEEVWVFKGKYYGLNRLFGFLKTFGGYVKVIEPRKLRDKLIRNYKELEGRY